MQEKSRKNAIFRQKTPIKQQKTGSAPQVYAIATPRMAPLSYTGGRVFSWIETDMRTHTARTQREYRRSTKPPMCKPNNSKGKEYKHCRLATQKCLRPTDSNYKKKGGQSFKKSHIRTNNFWYMQMFIRKMWTKNHEVVPVNRGKHRRKGAKYVNP